MPIYESETVHEPLPAPPGHRRRTFLHTLLTLAGLMFILAVPMHFLLVAIDSFFSTELTPLYQPIRKIALLPVQIIDWIVTHLT